ncbi:MAG: hypothetical protein ACXAEN_26035, partial [Candidatus Thorarchaeota archaeon]
DHKERTAHPNTGHLNGGGLTAYAEGVQAYTGRLFIVEEPLTANLHAWAGIVKSLGPKIGADGDMIEIYVPTEGAIVPVYTAQNCTNDRTIMGIYNAQADVDFPGRPIGIAKETIDRSGTDGLCWMQFKSFEYSTINGGGDATANSLIIDDEAAANAVTIKAMNLKFTGTGRARGLYYVGDINGAGHANYGMFKFRTYISAAMSQTVHTLCANLHIKDAGTLTDAGEWASSPLYVTVETEVTTTAPTLSGGSIAGIYFGYYVDESTAGPANAFVFHFNNHASYNWDGLIRMGAGDLGDSLSGADEAAHVIGFDGDGITRKIPIDVDGATYYLLVGTAIQGVADA